MENRKSVLTASTVAEQAFSVANNQMHANSSSTTVNNNMSFFINVYGAFTKDIRARLQKYNEPDDSSMDIEDTTEEEYIRKPPLLFGSKHAVYELIAHVHNRCKTMMQNEYIEIKSCRELQGIGKTKKDILKATRYAYKEMEDNARNSTERLSANTLGNLTKRYYDAYENNKTTKHDTLDDMYNKIITDKKWNIQVIKKYLQDIYKEQQESINKINKKELTSLLITFWKENSISVEMVRDIIL